MTMRELYACIDGVWPFAAALEDDNPGFLVGDLDADVTGILVALDVTAAAIDAAKAKGCNVIVDHHPVIWRPMSCLPAGKVPYLLAQARVAALCVHTNLDACPGGINDVLACRLGLLEISPLADPKTPGKPPMARVGTLPAPMRAPELAGYIKQKLDAAVVRFNACDGKIRRVAVCGGAGAFLWPEALALGAHSFVTGDVRQHEWLEAAHAGMTLIDAGHFETEAVIVPVLAGMLRERFPEVKVEILEEKTPFEVI